MRKNLIILACLLILLSWSTSAYSKKEEECTCANQNTSLSEAIRSEMADVFDSQTGFAAEGLKFVDNITKDLGSAGTTSSLDITLTNETPAAPATPPKCVCAGNSTDAVCNCR